MTKRTQHIANLIPITSAILLVANTLAFALGPTVCAVYPYDAPNDTTNMIETVTKQYASHFTGTSLWSYLVV